MQSTTITFLPTPLPQVDFVLRGGEEDISVDYLIAAYQGNALNFENKITLSGGGQIVQIMTKDASGLFTQALEQNAFSIDGDFLGIQLYAPVSGANGFQYSARLFKNSSTRATTVAGTGSQVVLQDSQNNPPQIIFAEIVTQIGTTILQEVSFIGTTDLRGAFTSRVTVRPGETVYIKRNSNGDIVFQY